MLKYSLGIEEIDGLDDAVKGLYKEIDGNYVLEVDGVKPLNEFEVVHNALQKERAEHKSVKARLDGYGDRTADDVLKMQDKIAELEAMTNGDTTDVESLLAARMLPVNRDRDNAVAKLAEAETRLAQMEEKMMTNQREQDVMKFASATIKPECLNDIQLRARYELKYNEDVQDFVDENGARLEEWIQIQATKSPWMMLDSQSAGAHASRTSASTVKNPFDKNSPNFSQTEQAKLFKTQPTLAAKLAKQAGWDI